MPGTTTNQGYPYPLDSDLIDAAGDIQNLAEAIDTDIADALASVTDKVSRTGDTMTGMLTLPGATPTSLNHAARKGYVDDQTDLRVAVAGDTMTGELNMSTNKISGLAPPTGSADAANKQYVDAAMADVVHLNQTSVQIMTGTLRAPKFTLTDLNPDNPDEVTSKQYVDETVDDAAELINHVLVVDFDDHVQTSEVSLKSGVAILTTNTFASCQINFAVAFMFTPQFFATSGEATQQLVLGTSNSATSVVHGTCHVKNFAGAAMPDTVVQLNWFACGISPS